MGRTRRKARSENIINLLMRRDGMSKKEAEDRYDEVKSELQDAMFGTSCMDPEEVLADELGLEPDYIFEFI